MNSRDGHSNPRNQRYVSTTAPKPVRRSRVLCRNCSAERISILGALVASAVLMAGVGAPSASTLVMIYRDTVLTIGVDSATHIVERDSIRTSDKFMELDSFWVFHVGIRSFIHTGYNYNQVISRSFPDGRFTPAAIENYRTLVRQEFERILSHVRHNPNTAFAKSADRDRYHIASVFVVQTKGPPIFVHHQVRSSPSLDRIEERYDRGPRSIPARDWTYVGSGSAIRAILSADPDYWWRERPHAVIRGLISAQIRVDPAFVNFPIKVFQFYGGTVDKHVFTE